MADMDIQRRNNVTVSGNPGFADGLDDDTALLALGVPADPAAPAPSSAG